MKIRDLFLINKDFARIQILAGEKGLDREVKDIDIFEVPDGIYWTEEGELSITTGFYYKDNPEDLMKVIDVQHEKKAAGMGIKLGRFINEIPKSVIDRANELDFPVLNIPVNIGYSDIIWTVVSLLLGENSYEDYMMSKFKKELYYTINEKYYLNNLVLLLNNYLNSDVYVIEKDQFNLIKSLPSEKDYPLFKDLILENDLLKDKNVIVEKRDNKYFRIYKIFHHGVIYGYFGIVSDDFDDQKASLEMKFLKEIYTHIVIYILNYSKSILEYIKSADELFLKLIHGSYEGEETSLKEDAKLLGVDYYQRRIIFSLVYKNKMTNNIKKEMANYLRRIFANQIKDLYLVEEIERIVLIMSLSNLSRDSVEKTAQDILDKILLSYPHDRIKIGISKECSSLKYISSAYEESVFAEKIGDSFEDKEIYLYDDYMVYHILTKLHNHPAVKKIYRNIIVKIRKEGGSSHDELIKTLKKLTENDFNISKTSEELYLHRNTLYKRINKIQKIIGYDFEQSDTKLILKMVSKLDDLIN
ncbi:MAG: PucR family transcriptional regulator ligand-binding domain-containing protein [Clostridia bacterium]|nr:PucR family transcriptional regulator ligand-binding domain-containing protein [Clostridia bacterium]